jgi:dihydroorotase-like cyclic amidohydrolase
MKNVNVTSEHGSYKSDVVVKDNNVVMVGKGIKIDGIKEIDGANLVSESIITWFSGSKEDLI